MPRRAAITVPGIGDVAEKAAEITGLRGEAQRLEAAAGRAASDYAKVMSREGVPVRDIAELLDVSAATRQSHRQLVLRK